MCIRDSPSDERGGVDGGFAQRRTAAGCSNDSWSRRALGLMDGRVREYYAMKLRQVALGPTQRDWSAPVMGNRDDPAGDLKFEGERAQVLDSIGESAGRAGSIRKTHVEVIDCDAANVIWQLT